MRMNSPSTLDECGFQNLLTDETRAVLAGLPATWSGLYIRAIDEAIAGKRVLLNRIRAAISMEATLPPTVTIREEVIETDAGGLRVRIYIPEKRSAGASAVFYVHGGGWCIGGVGNCSSFCIALTERLAVPVIVPDYRLAPENPFPCANDDLYAAASWLCKNAEMFTVDPRKIIFSGDSAGGQLAISTALRLLDFGEQLPLAQILFYPVATLEDRPETATGTCADFDKGGMLSKELFAAMKKTYLSEEKLRGARYVSPLATSLSGLPPTLIVTAECDLLRDDAELLAKQLSSAGTVPARIRKISGVPHAFLTSPGFNLARAQTLDCVAEFFQTMLA